MTNISPKLQMLLQRASPETPVELNVLLRQEIPTEAIHDTVRQIQALVSQPELVELLQRQRMVLCTAALHSVERIAQLPAVMWIDLDNQAAVETLLN